MTFLPIIWRELSVAARKSATFRVRLIIVASCMVLWVLLTLSGSRLSSRELSRILFTGFGVLALAFTLLAGFVLTADCLSEEKREGTLGLLFLTPLRGYDVVLGKLVANGLHSVYGLLAIFPILSLPLLMGGVSFYAFLRVVLVLVLTLFFSLGVGMVVSVFSRETRDAFARASFILILFSGALPALWWLAGNLHNRIASLNFLVRCSPVFAFRMALDGYYLPSTRGEFWLSCLMLTFFFALSLALACFYLPKCWQEKLPLAARPNSDQKQPVNPLRLTHELNPIYWLGTRPGAPSSAQRLLFLLVGLVWLVSLTLSIILRDSHEAFVVCLFAAFGFHLVAKGSNILESTRQMAIARSSGALELLLVTPLTDREIHRGLFAAIHSRCLRRNLAMQGINAAILLTVLSFSSPFMDSRDKAIFSEILLGGALLAWLDFLAIRSVGIWSAFTAQSHNRALIPAVSRVLLPPWGALFFLVFMMSVIRRGGPGTAAFLIAMWIGFSVAWNLLTLQWANAKLRGGFRLRENSALTSAAASPLLDAGELNPIGA